MENQLNDNLLVQVETVGLPVESSDQLVVQRVHVQRTELAVLAAGLVRYLRKLY